MHWNLIYGGAARVVLRIAALFLTRTPRSDSVVAFGAFALAFGTACVIAGTVGLVRLRSDPK
jgi:hypothetical protein